MLDSDEGSDLVLRCKDSKTFKVHKVIICANFKFFEKAFNTEVFKESYQDRIKLEFVDSKIMWLLLNFCYTLDYDDSPFQNQMLANVDLYMAADFYDIAELRLLAAYKFERAATVGALQSD
jgi:hypothetical protein